MPLDDPLHGRQSHARSRKIVPVMKPLKGPKEPSSLDAVKPRAVVTNKIDAAPVALCLPQFDTSGFTFRGEFPGVSHEIFQHDQHQALVRVCFQSVMDQELSSAFGLAISQLRSNGASKSAQVHLLQLN